MSQRIVVTLWDEDEVRGFEWVFGTDEVRVYANAGLGPITLDTVKLAPGYGIEAVRETARIYLKEHS